MKKIISVILFVYMFFAGFSAFASESVYSDIENHWAEKTIEKWSTYGIINGYENKFFPDYYITRGEFATIVNRILKFDVPSRNTFIDLKEDYYTNNILCLNSKGIINGYAGEIRPDDTITREEAGVMICKALAMRKGETLKKGFIDEDDISSWAKPYMISLVNEGFYNGDNDVLRPKDNITRAEAVKLLDNCIEIVSEDADSAEFDRVCIINSNNLVLKGCKFEKDVIVSGDVNNLSLENSSVTGTLRALGSSKNSVRLKNCYVLSVDAIHPMVIYRENSDANDEITDNIEESEIKDADSLEDIDEIIKEDDGELNSPCIFEDEENFQDEEEHIVIETTLTNGLIQKNSKKVFDVLAKDKNGFKIDCSVRCNDINIEPSWDDETKTSFTLEFQESGEYVVEITATDAEGITQKKTYNITYEMAEYGEPIGKATVCIEAFTVGGGYIVAPIEIDVLEGINCAYLLDEFLTNNNLAYMSTGSLDGGFYLATISDIPEFTPIICESLLMALTDAGFDVLLDSYSQGELSEFDFTQGSGWMYCVNGIFPNVGFSEYYLQDGDVMRIQFTLAYGSDIGGSSGAGFAYTEDFYEIVNRDELTKIIANIGVENCQEYIELITKPDMTNEELNSLMNSLK